MSTRPLIVLDALLVRSAPTGVGRSILELVRALADGDWGLRWAVLVSRPEMFRFLEGRSGWQIISCPGTHGSTLPKAIFTQLRLPRLVRTLGGDILHSLQFVAPLGLDRPRVVTVHDLAFLEYPATVEEPRRSYYRLLVPATLRRAAMVTTNSRATAEDVLRRFPELAGRVTPTPWGTPSWVWGQPGGERKVAADAPFLFVGTLEPRKNLERLLEAYARYLDLVAAAGPPRRAVPLTLVGGRGWRDSRLRRRIAALRERGVLRLEGYCDPAQLWRHYRSARALLFPSLQEGFGFPILEAMAAGLPVLTSDRGAMREVAGGDALLVDPEDLDGLVSALDRMATDEALLARLRAAGPARARTWSWERAAEGTVRVYRRILDT